MQRGPCWNCDRRDACREPCERLKAELDSAFRARPPCNIDRRSQEEIDLLLDYSPRLNQTTDAMVHLYYRAGFTMDRIGGAFAVNRSTVSRRLRTAWKKLARARNRAAV